MEDLIVVIEESLPSIVISISIIVTYNLEFC